MVLHRMEQAFRTAESCIDAVCDAGGTFLDNNPTLYKIVLIALHFFRSIPMFGAMMWFPIPLWATATGMLAGTFLYKVAVERFCCLRFVIPSMVGAGAVWCAHLAVVNFVSGAALSSVGRMMGNSLFFLPLLGYTAWVSYLSHYDIEKRMKLLSSSTQSIKPDCC